MSDPLREPGGRKRETFSSLDTGHCRRTVHRPAASLGGRLHAPSPRPGFEEVDWACHQQIVDLLVVGLRGGGNDIVVEVDLRSNDGRTARADIMDGRCGSDIARIEVKTSLVYDDYEQFTGDAFRRQQAAVLAQIPPGGKVRSPNAKVVKIGLVPNIAFPPIRLERRSRRGDHHEALSAGACDGYRERRPSDGIVRRGPA